MNTSFKVIGLTRLGIKPKSTAPEADAHTTRPSELLYLCLEHPGRLILANQFMSGALQMHFKEFIDGIDAALENPSLLSSFALICRILFNGTQCYRFMFCY